MDEKAGKKYEVLRDEKNAYIASSGDSRGFSQGDMMTVWMKFPAPPPDTRAATLVVNGMPPFDDLPIQGQ